ACAAGRRARAPHAVEHSAVRANTGQEAAGRRYPPVARAIRRLERCCQRERWRTCLATGSAVDWEFSVSFPSGLWTDMGWPRADWGGSARCVRLVACGICTGSATRVRRAELVLSARRERAGGKRTVCRPAVSDGDRCAAALWKSAILAVRPG